HTLTPRSCSFSPGERRASPSIPRRRSADLNAGTATACNDPGETSVVNQATPVLTTVATPTALVGGSISDTANLAGGFGTLGGTITFTLYGPNDATCGSAAIFTNTKAVVSSGGGTGTATSDPFTPSQAGTYRWRASYSGDTNNTGRANACTAAT